MSEWKEYKLVDLCTKIGSGATPRGGGESYKETGISLIRSQNVLDFQFSYSGLAFIDDEQADDLKNVMVKENDVLLNITGDSVARVCKVPKKVLPARVNQHVAIIRSDEERLNSDFLLYYLLKLKEHLLSISEIGATRRAITKGMIESLEIYIPEITEQTAIASVLSSLDNKIDLLHRQNNTLEKMAETLFRQWFVVEAKEEWEEIKLGSIVDIINGVSYKSDDLNSSKTAMVTLKSFDRNGGFRMDGFKEYTGKYKEQHLLKEGDLVVAHTDITQEADVIGNPVMVIGNPKYDTLVFSMDLVKVVSKDENYSNEFLYLLMKSKEFKEHCLGYSNGSTVLHLSKKAVPEYEMKLPLNNLINEFSIKVKPLVQKQFRNQTQIRTLTALRDTLLPKLMSGAVTVDL